MPIRERLAQKGIHEDARRLRSMPKGRGGGVAPHTLLGQFHSDTVIAAPAQGGMILADSTPEWDILLHPAAAGYALVTDATDVAWDQTPTWTGDHTWDDGSGDSPALVLIGGSNDDTAKIYLDDDAVAGNSDLVVQLVANDDDTRLIVEQLGGTDVAYISGAGNLWLEGNILLTDDAEVGFSGAGRLVFDSTPNPDQIDVTDADLYFATAAHGIIHTDGVAAGMVLLANGTRYVPAAANANVPVAPGARGHIIRAEAGPVWASYDASTTGAVLIGDGTDIISDTTPTIAGLVTCSAGWVVTNAGGTGDLDGNDLLIDQDGDSYLHASGDDVVDLVLATASGEFGIWVNGAEDFTFTANSFNVPSGSFITMADDTGIGIGAAAGRITFDDQATDQVEIQGAVLIVNDSTLDGNQSGNVMEVHDGHLGVQGVDGEPAIAQVFAYGASATDDFASFRGRKARGTQGTPTAAQADDTLARFGAGPYGATGFSAESTGHMRIVATENATDAAMGTHISFFTTPTSSVTPAQRVKISASGRMGIGEYTGIDTKLHVRQESAAGNIPVMKLEQDHVTLPFIEFQGTASAGVLTRSIVDYGDEASSTAAVWIKCKVEDDGNQVTDQAYYILGYTLA